jgi:undecaprenyl-diphosphatase
LRQSGNTSGRLARPDVPTGVRLAAASLAQVGALVPGVSRSGATVTALRLLRVERGEAARTSLLLSLPVTAAAALLPLARADRAQLRTLAPLLAAGVPAAAVSGRVAAGAWRRRPARSATAAAVYRLALADAVAARLRRRARAARPSRASHPEALPCPTSARSTP